MAKKNIQEYLSDENNSDKTILRCFKDFLIMHRCYRMFKTAYNEGRRMTPFVDDNPDIPRTCNFRIYFKELKDKSELINYAFLWESSGQGHSFWEKQNNEWKRFYNKTLRHH